MMLRRLIIVFLLLFMQQSVEGHRTFNYSSLMEQYLILCGPDFFCNIDKFNFPYISNLNFSSQPLCPSCECDSECFRRGDCCADRAFSLTSECLETTIINASRSIGIGRETSFLMVRTCPQNYDKAMSQKCENVTSTLQKIKFLPVTSTQTSVTYFNKFCAQCNGEFDFITWSIDIVCQEFADFNFLSTFEDVVKQGIERQCVIQAFPPNNNTAYNCSRPTVGPIDSCNVTRYLNKSNTDIEYACHARYNIVDSLFKNVFCRICNPGFSSISTIDKCNMTGLYTKQDMHFFQEACTHHGYTPATQPYKNIFCFLCNRHYSSRETEFDQFAEIIGKVYSSVERSRYRYTGTIYKYRLLVNIKMFRYDYVSAEIKNVSENYNGSLVFVNDTFSINITTSNGHMVNITNLIYKKISLDGRIGVCNRGLFPPNFSSSLFNNCFCSKRCFGIDYCCDDVMFYHPGSCVNLRAFSRYTGPEAYVTSGCFLQTTFPQYMLRHCQTVANDLLSSHPVTDDGNFDGTPYQNMYCYLCNQAFWNNKNFQPTPHFFYHKPWDLVLRPCSIYIDHTHFILLENLIKTLRASGCDVRYNPPTEYELRECPRSSAFVTDKCNKTGNWQIEDPDVKWACEDLNRGTFPSWKLTLYWHTVYYKNPFCALCNPEFNSIRAKDSCHPDADPETSRACQFFPQVSFREPFKNAFCKDCSSDLGRTGPIVRPTSGPALELTFPPRTKEWVPIYRNLFSVDCTGETEISRQTQKNCSDTQIYDQVSDVCRNITCYPGKFLGVDGSCHPLFIQTKNLSYIIALGFTGKANRTLLVLDLLKTIQSTIQLQLQERLVLNRQPVVGFSIQVNQSCKTKNFVMKSNEFEGIMKIFMFIGEPVFRMDTENALYNMSTDIINSQIFNHSISFHLRPNHSAYFLSINQNLAFKSNCTVHTRSKLNMVPFEQYRMVPVSKVLMCQQVEISEDEYEINDYSASISLVKYRYVLSFERFSILPNGKARICVDDLENCFTKKQYSLFSEEDNRIRLLWIISLTFTLISLVCLTVAFITYCKFSPLRSLPGKNNMLLVLTLFLTQTVFQASTAESSVALCVGFGICLHYFWLAMFFSMSVNCFHMFRVFHPRLYSPQDKSQRSTFIKYCLITFLSPAVVVILNLIILISVTETLGYGAGKCFISHKISLIVTFIVPIALLCVVNIVFFAFTVRIIQNTPQIESNKAKRNDFIIFARLFTITGITWLLQVIDGFLPFSVFSYIACIINSLQGVFVFIAFICNERTINLYRSKKSLHRSVTRSGTGTQKRSETLETDCSTFKDINTTERSTE